MRPRRSERLAALRSRAGAVTGVSRVRRLEERYDRLATGVAEEDAFLQRLQQQVAELERGLGEVWPTP